MAELLIATHNKGKVAEIAAILSETPIRFFSLADLRIKHEVPETAATFSGNATLKALGYARASGLLTLADDSGLVVPALQGAPGVHTARFGGADLSAKQRYEYLLAQMNRVPVEERAASFHCAMVLATPTRVIRETTGILEGRIALAPSGTGGFGYDPVFYLPAYDLTLAQLPPATKNRLSHRARALAQMVPHIRAYATGEPH